MNEQPFPAWMTLARAAVILGSFLIVAALVWAMHYYTRPPPLGYERAALRTKALADMHGAEAEGLSTSVWLDRSKGLVRLPIDNAMQLVVRQWGRSPAAARSNLIARAENAAAQPPRAPEKPSPFE